MLLSVAKNTLNQNNNPSLKVINYNNLVFGNIFLEVKMPRK